MTRTGYGNTIPSHLRYLQRSTCVSLGCACVRTQESVETLTHRDCFFPFDCDCDSKSLFFPDIGSVSPTMGLENHSLTPDRMPPLSSPFEVVDIGFHRPSFSCSSPEQYTSPEQYPSPERYHNIEQIPHHEDASTTEQYGDEVYPLEEDPWGEYALPYPQLENLTNLDDGALVVDRPAFISDTETPLSLEEAGSMEVLFARQPRTIIHIAQDQRFSWYDHTISSPSEGDEHLAPSFQSLKGQCVTPESTHNDAVGSFVPSESPGASSVQAEHSSSRRGEQHGPTVVDNSGISFASDRPPPRRSRSLHLPASYIANNFTRPIARRRVSATGVKRAWASWEKERVDLVMSDLIEKHRRSWSGQSWQQACQILRDDHNIDRTWRAIKNEWSRYGRQRTGLDERNRPEGRKLVTGYESPLERKVKRQAKKMEEIRNQRMAAHWQLSLADTDHDIHDSEGTETRRPGSTLNHCESRIEEVLGDDDAEPGADIWETADEQEEEYEDDE